jgi:hypothetical protein
MEPILATVNINIGLGKNNPVLTIRASDNVADMVEKVINDYQLPKKVHAIIMERVKQELPEPSTPTIKAKETVTRTPLAERARSVSPINKSNPSTAKLVAKRPAVATK